MSLYASYLKERTGDEIIEVEEGFATYRFIEDDGKSTVYIVDIYIRPDFRKTRMATVLADEIVDLAKKRGCTRMLGSVSAVSKHPTDSIKVLLAYGMEFHKCNEYGIFFKKEI